MSTTAEILAPPQAVPASVSLAGGRRYPDSP